MTGGEPLLAWQRLYIDLFEHERMQDLKMLHLKQTLHKVYTQSLKNISQAKQDLKQHLVAQSSF